jgi:hypothetical protein
VRAGVAAIERYNLVDEDVNIQGYGYVLVDEDFNLL